MKENIDETTITLKELISLAKYGVDMPASAVEQLPLIGNQESLNQEFKVDRTWLEKAKKTVDDFKVQRDEVKKDYQSNKSR